MGLIQLLMSCAVVVILVAIANWLIGYLAPQHPPLIDRLLWTLAVIIIAITIWRSLGGPDVQLPKL